MTTSEQIGELATALAKAQAEMDDAKKGSANPFFHSKYADLASVRDACIPHLSKNGIAVVQSPETAGAVVSVETRLIHASGQWIAGVVSCTAKDDGPQSIGSAVTYLRRYGMLAFSSVAPAEDDGEAAQGRNGKAKTAAPPVPAGYDDWLNDLTFTADDGTARLEATWKASKAEYRSYLTTTGPGIWDALKKRAAAVKVAVVR